MKRWIRRLLTKRHFVPVTKKTREVRVKDELPSESLVMLFQFAIVVIAVLAAVEVVHVVFLGVWNENVFNAIVGLIGTVTGIIVGKKT